MTQTIRQLIDEQATWLVGRDDEMDVLRRLLGEDGPLVVFVHGIAGIGKSALVEAFGVEARAAGATVLRLDCRSIEPTERGFLAALEGKTGGRADAPPRRPRPGWTGSVNGSCSFSTRMNSLGCSIHGCARRSCPPCRTGSGSSCRVGSRP